MRGEHAYDPHASPTEMRRLSGGLAGLYTEPALALDFGTYRPRDVLTFPANKDRTWRLPTELDPVRLMHNAIRAEVTKFEALLFKLGDAKLSGWQIQCIKVRHDPTRLLIFLLEFVSILHSRVSSRERTSEPRFMKREDIAAGSRVARIYQRQTSPTTSPQTLTTSPYTTHAHTQDWWVGHRDHVVNHHAMEDRTLHPYVRSRVHVPVEFQASHDQLACMVRTVNRAICNRHFTRASELVLVWHGYRTSLYPLLAEEEAILIPLTRAYFTPEEYGAKIGEILRSTPKLAMGSLLHHLQGGKEGAMGFLVRYGFEWTAWYSWAHAARTQYRENMESKLASLLVGAPVTRRHKDDLRILKTLKPLELNRRLMLSPMASADVSALVFSQMATGRWLLDVEWGFSQMDGVDTSRVVQAERERLIV